MSGRHLVLVGYRGTGKTTHGRALAGRLALPFLDTDERIVALAGKPVPRIFAEDGETAFRDLEERVIGALAAEPPSVVSTGGGAVIREANRRRLRAAGFVIWLQAADAHVFARIGGDANRPALTGHPPLAEISLLQAERAPWYREIAALSIDTGMLDFPEALEREIAAYRAFLQG